MGGEKSIAATEFKSGLGSPPHGRGKGPGSSAAHKPLWITPAWAGKSFDSLTVCRRFRDHPRMGGEKLLFQLGVLYPLGSPPHGRGKVVSGFDFAV